nr:unnamed protein product [Digitaria exilis]
MDHPKRSTAAAAPSLPDDALVEILSRLPAKSLCRFKCVSVAWRDLIVDRLRCNRLPQTLEGFFYVFDGDDEAQGGSSDAGAVSPDHAVHGRFINTLGKPSPLASFSFLAKQPGIEKFGLLHSCNSLLLFGHRRAGDSYDSLGYIVCNPATERWVAVPSSGWRPDDDDESEDSDSETSCTFTYLVFDPAVSSHFQLVQFWVGKTKWVHGVHTYSSETGMWCRRLSTWGDDFVAFFAGSAFVGGMPHFNDTSYCGWEPELEIIVAVDGEGANCRLIIGPEKLCDVAFVGQSQGRLHYVNEHGDSTDEMTGLSIWVLQDYDKEEWVLKHTLGSETDII